MATTSTLLQYMTPLRWNICPMKGFSVQDVTSLSSSPQTDPWLPLEQPSDMKAGRSHRTASCTCHPTCVLKSAFCVYSFCERHVLRALREVRQLQQQRLQLRFGSGGWILMRPRLHARAGICSDRVRGHWKPPVEWDRTSLQGWVRRLNLLKQFWSIKSLENEKTFHWRSWSDVGDFSP